MRRGAKEVRGQSSPAAAAGNPQHDGTSRQRAGAALRQAGPHAPSDIAGLCLGCRLRTMQGSRTPKAGRQKQDGGGCVPAPRRSRITAAQTTPPLPVRDADGATAPCPIPARDGIPVRNDGATRRGACGGVAPARRVRDLRPQLAQRALRTGHRGPQAAVSPLRRGQNPQSRRTDAARAGIDAGQMPRAGACRRMLHGATRPGRRAAFRPHRRGHRPTRRCGRPIYPRCGRKPLVILRTRQNILSLSGRKIVLSLRRSRRREGTIAGKTVLDRRPAGTNLFRSRRTQKNKCRILNPNR